MLSNKLNFALRGDSVETGQGCQADIALAFTFTAEKPIRKGSSVRAVLKDISNTSRLEQGGVEKRLSSSPVAKKGRKMGSDLDILAAQIAHNSEENKRLQQLLNEKTAMLQKSDPALGGGADPGASSSGVKVFRVAVPPDKGKTVMATAEALKIGKNSLALGTNTEQTQANLTKGPQPGVATGQHLHTSPADRGVLGGGVRSQAEQRRRAIDKTCERPKQSPTGNQPSESGNRFDVLTSMEEDDQEGSPATGEVYTGVVSPATLKDPTIAALTPSGNQTNPLGVMNQEQADTVLMDITKEAKRKRELAEVAKQKDTAKGRNQSTQSENTTRNGGPPAQTRIQQTPNELLIRV
ncbi:hypothetical protein R1sor_007827 [Riccia sorocarpa]|uniref:Uncharacterized protein n=1 Tax=Riccia sorocarpa TaxID=122646 RepID=A0ABD3HTR6_9MARC